MPICKEWWDEASAEWQRVVRQLSEQAGEAPPETVEPLRGCPQLTLMYHNEVDATTATRALSLPLGLIGWSWNPANETFEKYVASLVRSVAQFSW